MSKKAKLNKKLIFFEFKTNKKITINRNVVLYFLFKENEKYFFSIKKFLLRKKIYKNSSSIELKKNEFIWLKN